MKSLSFGNMLARMHTQAERNSKPLLPDAKLRHCWYGNHTVTRKGGKMIGGKWACEKCKGVV